MRKFLIAPLLAAVLATPATAQEEAPDVVVISAAEAIAVAQAEYPEAVIVEVKLERDRENGWNWLWGEDESRWVWEIEAVGQDDAEYELKVAALTGELLEAEED